MTERRISRRAWRIWVIAMAAGFVALEAPAIFNTFPGDTLSEYVWAWEGYRFVIVGLLVWLTLHFGWKV